MVGIECDSLVEYVANVSEGRRPDVIHDLVESARGPGAFVLDVHSDVDHNRSVITVVGAGMSVAESAFHLAETAVARIDMRAHRGTHPRLGALDVLPFVPLGQTTMESCVALAHEVGQRIGTSLGVPVYFYGAAALRPERRLLAEVRRGEYEGLTQSIVSDPARRPDAGPATIGAPGAVVVGARAPLIAMNVHLRTDDLRAAREIARRIRASSGGLPGVLALGLPTSRPGIVQVSMNLVNLLVSPPHVVVAAVRAEAGALGIELAETELVGLMPAAAALSAASSAMGLPALGSAQVIELAVSAALQGSGVS